MNHPNASRRDFLKTSATAAALIGAPAILSAADEKPADPTKTAATPKTAAASTEVSSKIKLALVGCGGQGRSDLKNLLNNGAALAALCDVDKAQMDKARADVAKQAGDAAKSAKGYEDYRELLAQADQFDAVLIATPDHWHHPIAKAFIKAGKHVFCEKPLTHSVAEARELREIARSNPKVVTQMGNQGSASVSLRRCVEVIKSGAIGQVKEIYHWGIGVTANEGNAPGAEDAIPAGLNWDMWCGPSAVRPFKKDVYHPFKWRSWFDFGNGGLADFCCHAINLPLRALDLNHPERLVVNMKDGKQLAGKAALEFHFGARGNLAPVVLHWQGSGTPPEHILKPLIETYKPKEEPKPAAAATTDGKAKPKPAAKPEQAKIPNGLLIVGEKGWIHTTHWNGSGILMLEGDKRMSDITRHPGVKEVPQSLPRVANHYAEWINAIRGEGATFSPFDFGGKLTEIGLAGVAAIRTGRT
ncbi:MAG TPA: Gfo/Idh/MocA family oxidoreductase, partial [Tepidisphaeraceae bacterium]|nr:Gfo/Idh/MocA family oxidoreductase [Tepidisphaeraceae bacterium]